MLAPVSPKAQRDTRETSLHPEPHGQQPNAARIVPRGQQGRTAGPPLIREVISSGQPHMPVHQPGHPATQRDTVRLPAALQVIRVLHPSRDLQQHIAQILMVHTNRAPV